MQCPHCAVGVKLQFKGEFIVPEKDDREASIGYKFTIETCPECKNPIVIMHVGKYTLEIDEAPFDGIHEVEEITEIDRKEIIYPRYVARKVEAEVPDACSIDFLEACAVQSLSAKASAALSRRILQNILREKFEIKHQNLAKEIDEFIQLDGVPSYLTNAVDAIRNVGNLAA